MKATCIVLLGVLIVPVAIAQTVYVPSGTSGIGTSGNSNVGVGTSTPADQVEVVSGVRKVGLNGTIAGVTTGALLSLSRPGDGMKTMFFGSTDVNNDHVIFSQGGATELRLVSGGGTSAGFGFYNNVTLAAAFGTTRPTPVMKIDGAGNMGIGTATPTSKLHIVGAGSTTADIKVNGRLQVGDAANNGGIIINGTPSMYIGQTGNTLSFWNGTSRIDMTSNGYLGIGTANPATKLEVLGAGNTSIDMKVNGRIVTGDAGGNGGVWLNTGQNLLVGQYAPNVMGLYNDGWRVFVRNNGNFGIGHANPQVKLDVAGTGGGIVDMRVNGRIVTGDAGNVGGIFVNSAQTQFLGQFNATTMGIFNNGAWRFFVDDAGNVGIGTNGSTIDSKLAVRGKIHSQEVKVDLIGSAAPDYVFNEDYKLPSLETVKAYIDQNHHLPEVPSAKEMETNGIELGEMNMLLLKKIEELTLYVIELKKENEVQSKQLSDQAKTIESLVSKK